MKTTVKLPIPSGARILVNSGDKISDKTLLIETYLEQEEKIIPLAEILQIPPGNIPKFLKKAIGAQVKKGDLLAEKKSLLVSFRLESPESGKIKEIDLKNGTMILLTGNTSMSRKKVTSPFGGKITAVGKNYLDLEIEGQSYIASKGGGSEAFGELFFEKDLQFHDIDCQIEGKIMLCQSLSEEMMVKLEVLEAAGCIVQKANLNFTLPWIQVDEDTFEKLSQKKGKIVWLRPEEKEIIILE